MLNVKSLAAMAATGMLASAAPASAALYTITYEGVVADGWDYGLFGVNGTLAGRAYTAVYTVNTAAPGAMFNTYPSFSTLSGLGAVSAALTLNGVTRTYGNQNGYVNEMDAALFGPDSLASGVYHTETICGAGGSDCVEYFAGLSHAIISTIGDVVDGDLLTPPSAYLVNASDEVYTGFYDRRYIDPSLGTYQDRAFANFKVTKITGAPLAVPEPGSWALMILGFGGVGALLRRRALVQT